MLFNSTETLTYKDIADTTDIPAQELKRSLQGLACVKVGAQGVPVSEVHSLRSCL